MNDYLIIYTHYSNISIGELMIVNDKYAMEVHQKSLFEASMTMSIKKIGQDDLGSYTCVAKNSLGDVESKIRLYGTY